MEFDRNNVDEIVLALLWLTAFDADEFGACGNRTIKGRWIGCTRRDTSRDPKSKASRGC